MEEIKYSPYPVYVKRFQKWFFELDEFGIRHCYLRDDYKCLEEELIKELNPVREAFDKSLLLDEDERKKREEVFYNALFSRLEERKNKRISELKGNLERISRERRAKIFGEEKDLNT